MRTPRQLDRHVPIEARRVEGDRPLERRDGLTHVRENARDVFFVPEIGKAAEDGFVVLLVERSDVLRVLRAVAAVLDAALERAEGLRPLTVFAAIPEHPG